MSITMDTSLLICGANIVDRNKKALEIASSISNKEDVLFFDASEVAGIGEVKSLIAKLSKKPYSSSFISAIVSEAQNLTLEAQNSLLKILEEPNKTSRLFLTAPSEFSLLSTISSRCKKIYLKTNVTPSQGGLLAQTIMTSRVSDRLDLSDKLELVEWIEFLRHLLRKSISDGKMSRYNITKIVKYLRFVERVFANKVLANPKLAKYLVVMSIPRGLQALASNPQI